MDLIKLFLPLALFTPVNCAAAALSRRKFGETLPTVLCGAAFLLYLSQYIFSTYVCAYVALISLAVLSVPLLVLLFIRKPERRRFVVTPGAIAFFVVFAFACAILIGKKFGDWDEFTHWGMMVKESLRLDRFHCVTESRVKWHKDYPPFTVLFETLWCRLSGYSEGRVTIAAQVLTLSVFLPFLMEKLWDCRKDRALNRSNWFVPILQAAAIEVVLLMFDFSLDNWPQKIVNSILPDAMLSFFFAYLFLHILIDRFDGYSVAATAVVGSAMLMTKQVGAAFLLVILLLVFVKGLTEKKGARAAGSFYLKYAVVVLVPVAVYMSWALYKRRYIDPADNSYMYGQFNLSQIDFSAYLRAVKGQGDGIMSETLANYAKALFSWRINNIPFLPLTYFTAYCLSLLALAALAIVFKEDFPRREAVATGIVFTVGTVGYAFMMSVMYLFCFNDGEKSYLAGFTRYMDSYVLGEMLVLLALLFLLARKRRARRDEGVPRARDWLRYVAAALVSLVLFNPANARNLLNLSSVEDPFAYYQTYADQLREIVPTDSKVFIVYDRTRTIHPDWYDPMQLFVQYYADNLNIDYKFNGAYSAKYAKRKRKKAIVKEIGTCDYLYVAHTGENFDEGMREYNGGNAFIEGGVYAVDTDEGALRLTLFDITGPTGG